MIDAPVPRLPAVTIALPGAPLMATVAPHGWPKAGYVARGLRFAGVRPGTR